MSCGWEIIAQESAPTGGVPTVARQPSGTRIDTSSVRRSLLAGQRPNRVQSPRVSRLVALAKTRRVRLPSEEVPSANLT